MTLQVNRTIELFGNAFKRRNLKTPDVVGGNTWKRRFSKAMTSRQPCNLLYPQGCTQAFLLPSIDVFSSCSGIVRIGPDTYLATDQSRIMANHMKLLTSPLRIMNISCPMSPLCTMYSFAWTCAGFTLVHNRRMKGRFVSWNSGIFWKKTQIKTK